MCRHMFYVEPCRPPRGPWRSSTQSSLRGTKMGGPLRRWGELLRRWGGSSIFGSEERRTPHLRRSPPHHRRCTPHLPPSRPEERSHLRSSAPKNGPKIGPKIGEGATSSKLGEDFFEDGGGDFFEPHLRRSATHRRRSPPIFHFLGPNKEVISHFLGWKNEEHPFLFFSDTPNQPSPGPLRANLPIDLPARKSVRRSRSAFYSSPWGPWRSSTQSSLRRS